MLRLTFESAVRVVGAVSAAAVACITLSSHAAGESQQQVQIVGTVIDRSGAPLEADVGIVVTQAVEQLASPSHGSSLSVSTDSHGHFTLSVPRSLGQVSVVVRSAKRAPLRLASVDLTKQRLDVGRLILPLGQHLKGRAFDEAGTALSGVSVTVVRLEEPADTIRQRARGQTATSSMRGEFVIEGLESGKHLVTAKRAGFLSHSLRNVYVPASYGGLLKIQLSRGVYLSGRVADSGRRPVQGATISSWSDPEHPLTATSDAAGKFQVGPFLPGSSIEVRTSAPGFNPARSDGIAVPARDFVVTLDRLALFRGRVVAQDTQQGISNFEVTFHLKSATPSRTAAHPGRRTFKSNDGRFEWRDVQSGLWTVTISARGYEPLVVPALSITSELDAETTFELRKGTTLQVRVIDARTSRGIGGASLSYLRERANADAQLRAFHPSPVTTDQDGAALLEDLPLGQIVVYVSAAGYVDATHEVSAGVDDLAEVRLSSGGRIAGKVLGSDGAVATQGMIHVWNPALDSGTYERIRPDGTFEFRTLSAGRYLVTGKVAQRQTLPLEVVLSDGGDVGDIVLTVVKGRNIRGTVSGLLPGERGRVRIDLVIDENFRASGSPDDSGVFELHGVPSGNAIVTATTPLDRSLSKAVAIGDSADVAIDFSFPAGAAIYGRVTRGGQPVRFAILRARPLDGQEVLSNGETTQSGQYSIAGLSPGNYQVTVLGSGKSVSVLVRGDTHLDIELPSLSVSGTVMDVASGKVVTNVQINVRPTDPKLRGPILNGRTDYQGRFTLTGLDVGQYDLRAYRPGYDAFQVTLEVVDSISSISIPLVVAEGIQLRVVDALTGLPIRQVLLMETMSDTAVNFIELQLNEQGVGRLPPSLKDKDLVIWTDGYEKVSIPRWTGRPTDVRLSPKRRGKEDSVRFHNW